MTRLILIVFMSMVLNGCSSNKHEVDVVNIPIPIVAKIEPLEEFVSRCDKFSKADSRDYKKIALACKRDLEILTKRDQIHQRLIRQHNGD